MKYILSLQLYILQLFLHISIFFGSISIANTFEQYFENCITFPPLPQKPSITE